MSRQYNDEGFDPKNETAEVVAGVDVDTGKVKLLPIKNGKVDTTATVVGATGGVSQEDETTFVEGADLFTPVGGVVNDAPTSDPTEDQAAAIRITPKRAAHVNLRKQDGTELGITANPLEVDSDAINTKLDSVISNTDTVEAKLQSLLDGQKFVRQKTRYDIGVSTIYIGYAANGTGEGVAAWTIKKITFVAGSPSVAEWTAVESTKWDDRATATYS